MSGMLTGNMWLKGLVNGFSPAAQDGAEVAAKFGRNGDMIVGQQFGPYSEKCSRNVVGLVSIAAATLPVVANNLVSVMTIFNPANSGYYLELIDADFSTVLATTVVDSVGLYSSSVTLSTAGTFTTRGNVRSGILQNGFGGVGQFWSAYTHSGTPVLEKLLGGWAAVTDSGLNTVHYDFKGGILIPPGVASSFAMTTAASTGSGITGACSWVERPV